MKALGLNIWLRILTVHVIKSFISLSTSYGYLKPKNNVQLNVQKERGFYYIYSLSIYRKYS